MPVSSVQSAVIGLVTATVSLIVGLGLLNAHDGGEIIAYAGTAIGAVFVLANAIIHNGVTTATKRDASS